MKLLAQQTVQAFKALATRRLCVKSDGTPYYFEKLSLQRLSNAIFSELSVRCKPLSPWAWPTHLQVEPSTHCNLHCLLCPTSQGLDRPQGLMDLNLFKKALAEAGPYIFTLLLWDWGEPFVNPAIYAMIAHAKQYGIKVISSTNGHLFAKEAQAEALIHSGLDTIIFAIDGMTQSTYQQYRHGGDLPTVLEAMRTVARLKRRLGSLTPLVNFRFIVMASNEHEVPEVLRMAPQLGADVLTLKTLNHCLRDPERGEVEDLQLRQLAPRNPQYRRFLESPDGERIRRRQNPCKQLWNNPVVHWNGNVVPCSFDPQDHYTMGNLQQQSLREIWRGEPYRQLRRRFRQGWSQLPLCQECSYAYQGGSLNSETMAEMHFYAPAAKGALQ
jgi:radical SAM protein with 4Fe4S-binding SPASM domain